MKKLSRIEECRLIQDYLIGEINKMRGNGCIADANRLIGMWAEYEVEVIENQKRLLEDIRLERGNLMSRLKACENWLSR